MGKRTPAKLFFFSRDSLKEFFTDSVLHTHFQYKSPNIVELGKAHKEYCEYIINLLLQRKRPIPFVQVIGGDFNTGRGTQIDTYLFDERLQLVRRTEWCKPDFSVFTYLNNQQLEYTKAAELLRQLLEP